MLEWLIRIDHGLFFLINNGLGAEWLDPVFLGLSSLGEWTMAIMAAAFLADTGRRALLRHLLVVLAVLLVLAPIHYGLKSAVGRPRPKKEFAGQTERIVRMPLGNGDTPRRNAFPSGHSALAFFLMTYVALNRRAYRWPVLALAGLVAFSRVYVGAHFPSDCVAGSCTGAAGGWLAWWLFRRTNEQGKAVS
ncbi:MAG: phosphatase PAP2 family protein [Verrucomicrobiota bacterium]|nr:phosphatase PAP2 family protein [Verrucomicrobiota bacterium]